MKPEWPAGVGAAVPTRPDGIMIVLADMPELSTEHLDALVAAFRHSGPGSIVRAVAKGAPGNPVIVPQVLYGDLQQLGGDVGARSLIKSTGVRVVDVEIGAAALLAVDTVEQLFGRGRIAPIAREALIPRKALRFEICSEFGLLPFVCKHFR
jgi:molybdenum cofactor cytidylyltransferase